MPGSHALAELLQLRPAHPERPPCQRLLSHGPVGSCRVTSDLSIGLLGMWKIPLAPQVAIEEVTRRVADDPWVAGVISHIAAWTTDPCVCARYPRKWSGLNCPRLQRPIIMAATSSRSDCGGRLPVEKPSVSGKSFLHLKARQRPVAGRTRSQAHSPIQNNSRISQYLVVSAIRIVGIRQGRPFAKQDRILNVDIPK